MSYRELVRRLYPRLGEAVPQTVPLPGQVANHAGGYFYAVDDWARLDRFLTLGTEGGTYYVSAPKLTRDNVEAVLRCIEADGLRVVNRIVEISQAGRAPRNDPALFALALCAAAERAETRSAALDALPGVARTGSHLLAYAAFVEGVRGWGRGLRRAVGRWFTAVGAENLALQAVKYPQREGWSLRDLLRLSHPLTESREHRLLIDWIAHPEDAKAIASAREVFRLIDGRYRLREAASAREAADIVLRYSLPREAVPTEWLNHVEVWDALLVDMPMTAMIRNLGKMSAVGLLAPASDAARYVASRLADVGQLRAARIHPIQLLLALKTYARGRGVRGSLVWTPAAEVVDALDAAFHGAFDGLEPTGKRLLLGVDVSGSMHWGSCLGASVLELFEAAAALALQILRSEEKAHVIAFDTSLHDPGVSRSQRIDDVVRRFSRWRGGTDVSLPIRYAIDQRLEVDAFIIVTDNETWAGREHPAQALDRYRRRINPDARLVVLAMAANHGSVVPDDDPLALGVSGFDAAVPRLVGDFVWA